MNEWREREERKKTNVAVEQLLQESGLYAEAEALEAVLAQEVSGAQVVARPPVHEVRDALREPAPLVHVAHVSVGLQIRVNHLQTYEYAI